MSAQDYNPEPELPDAAALWEAYRRDSCEANMVALIRAYVPLVRRIVRQMAIYQSPSIDVEDLMQVALMGLWTSIDRYDADRGVPFEAYALTRIRSSVHDALRRQDPLSRTDREQLKQLNQATQTYLQAHGRAPEEDVLAELVGMDAEKMRFLLVRAQPTLSLNALMERSGESLGTLDERLADDNAPNPFAETSRREQIERFREAFKQLPSRQQKILYLYYFEDLTLKEVGAVMELTEARICQIHAGALLALRAILTAPPVRGGEPIAGGLP
jgi:RNA polymerase sigma factor FliA